tara:strand:- start:1162 stop:2343 length:1182 start_codon:yes stop_codon:yes gene_type:complete
MLRDKTIFVFSGSDWNDNAVSNMQISAILSKYNKLVYIETIGRRLPRLSEYKRVFRRVKAIFFKEDNKKKQGLDPINVTIVKPIAIPYHGNFIIDGLNKLLIFIQIRKYLPNNPKQELYTWTFSPLWQPFIKSLTKRFQIFHCVDALNTYDNSDFYLSLLNESIKTSDVVFTPGVLLEKDLKKKNDKTFLVGHGCGEELIKINSQINIPIEINNEKRSILVYAGTLANWVDYELLENLADSNNEILILLIGYIHALAPIDKVQSLLKKQNVLHVGYKNYEDLPSFYSKSHIGIVPYQSNNEHIQYSTPTKFLDYFSAGLKVVTTNFPAAHVYNDDFVKIANSSDDFAEKVQILLNEDKNNVEEIKNFALANTWEKKVEELCSIIEDEEMKNIN